jgi:hypothetical protein
VLLHFCRPALFLTNRKLPDTARCGRGHGPWRPRASRRPPRLPSPSSRIPSESMAAFAWVGEARGAAESALSLSLSLAPSSSVPVPVSLSLSLSRARGAAESALAEARRGADPRLAPRPTLGRIGVETPRLRLALAARAGAVAARAGAVAARAGAVAARAAALTARAAALTTVASRLAHAAPGHGGSRMGGSAARGKPSETSDVQGAPVRMASPAAPANLSPPVKAGFKPQARNAGRRTGSSRSDAAALSCEAAAERASLQAGRTVSRAEACGAAFGDRSREKSWRRGARRGAARRESRGRASAIPRLGQSGPRPIRASANSGLSQSAPRPFRASANPGLGQSGPRPIRASANPRLGQSAPRPIWASANPPRPRLVNPGLCSVSAVRGPLGRADLALGCPSPGPGPGPVATRRLAAREHTNVSHSPLETRPVLEAGGVRVLRARGT